MRNTQTRLTIRLHDGVYMRLSQIIQTMPYEILSRVISNDFYDGYNDLYDIEGYLKKYHNTTTLHTILEYIFSPTWWNTENREEYIKIIKSAVECLCLNQLTIEYNTVHAKITFKALSEQEKKYTRISNNTINTYTIILEKIFNLLPTGGELWYDSLVACLSNNLFCEASMNISKILERCLKNYMVNYLNTLNYNRNAKYSKDKSLSENDINSMVITKLAGICKEVGWMTEQMHTYCKAIATTRAKAVHDNNSNTVNVSLEVIENDLGHLQEILSFMKNDAIPF